MDTAVRMKLSACLKPLHPSLPSSSALNVITVITEFKKVDSMIVVHTS